MLTTVLVVLIVLALLSGGGGYYGSRRGWGYGGWSPFGLIVLLIILAIIFRW